MILLELPIEIIENIAGEDLFLQALFCKLQVYNEKRFIKNFKKICFEFYKNNIYKLKIDRELMYWTIAYTDEDFEWFSMDRHFIAKNIIKKGYVNYIGMQTYYIIFHMLENNCLFTFDRLWKYIPPEYPHIINRYMIYKNINVGYEFQPTHRFGTCTEYKIRLQLAIIANNYNVINMFNNLSYNEKADLLKNARHNDRIFNLLIKNKKYKDPRNNIPPIENRINIMLIISKLKKYKYK